ncbi:MAG: DUF4097 domain-containing protein [Candidatus Eremiobacteraeota bacterium]|nr:DUF4097 domain-containing protein [Candidatus Eremiobacteraeota bacterium]
MRRYSRTGVIAMLLAAEVLIVGIGALALGSSMHGLRAEAAGLHSEQFVPLPIAAIDAGPTPHVQISDPDSKVVVTASADGKVHVTDFTRVSGIVWGSAHLVQAHLIRTADGVQVERAPEKNNMSFSFGDITQRIEVAVPAGSTLDIERCSGANVSSLTGPVRVRSQDGRITASDLGGDLDALSSDGALEIRNVHAASVSLQSLDGHLHLVDVTTSHLLATTDDGSIQADGLVLSGTNAIGRIRTNDGSVRLHFLDGGNANVHAHTADGHIVINGQSMRGNDDGADTRDSLGNASGGLEVWTQSGAITLTTNGAL